MKTQNEIIKQGYNALINSLGITDTIRFIQYFSPGKGGYTKERQHWLDEKTLAEVLAEMKQLHSDDTNQYEKVIE
jgi:ribulose bisphosphate carboxylase small subunit